MSHRFELIGSREIPSLRLTFEEYRHAPTGARHLHMASADGNNAFLVAFLTVPQDSTGVAHILEHTSLCGSERYPVRDPFFMMIRRSLNTFMNAFTSSDWTAYPFASQNRKDFDNLLQVYLDAAFFPRLDPLDFAQEGHRLEFARPDDPDSELEFKGVVFNEMKGAMSSPVAQLYHTLYEHLFPTITYHHNSGGDPERITDLTHAQLKAFHARHYHPSNALFMTYGSFPAAEHQARMEELALERFGHLDVDLAIPDERRYDAPLAVESTYALDGEEAVHDKTHVVLGWLLGHSFDPEQMMEARLLSGVLLDNAASPLRYALESTDLGTAPSELCDVDDSGREAVFMCGLEGSEPERAEAVETLILDTLESVARDGVPAEHVESVLHQLELSQREVGGGRFPYGLQLMVRALPTALHGGDPVAALDIDPVLSSLRERIRDPGYIQDLTRRLLLDNPHRVRLTMAPDPQLSTRKAAAEASRLAELKARLDAGERRRIVEQAAALKARQEREDDPELLPKVGLEDVPAELNIPAGEPAPVHDMPGTVYVQPTNGLLYAQVVTELPALEPELLDDLPLYCELVTEVGAGQRDYREMQAWEASVSGGIGARTSLRSSIEDVQRARGVFVLSSKALARNADPLAELLAQTFARARFDELPRLREVVAQLRAAQESSVTDHGHVLAMTAATAGMGPSGALGHRWDGLLAIQRLKTLDDSLRDEQALEALAERLTRIRDALVGAPRQFLIVGEEASLEAARAGLAEHWAGLGAAAPDGTFQPPAVASRVQEGWTTSTQVSFCARAYPCVPQDHPDAPALTVLGPYLRNGFLHRAIREQGGAYGGGAGYSPDTAALRFYSYRDPRVAETLADFDRAVDWMLSGRHAPAQLEEAILNVVSDIDRPESPAGEAITAFFGELHGRTAEQRRRYRKAILEVGMDDLRRVAERYLRPEAASTAVLTSRAVLDRNAGLGLTPQRL